MFINVECLPDETLSKVIGFGKKQIIHHQGKSRVFANICKKTDQIAIVDEDPGSPKHEYEKQLILRDEANGIRYYLDQKRKNKVFVLSVKLEDWIIFQCKKSNIDIKGYGLPDKPNDLHNVINYRLEAFKNLLNDLIQTEAFTKLKKWINEKI